MLRYNLSAAIVLLVLVGMLTGTTFASHEPAGGGEDCVVATAINSLPFSDTGTTSGFADDYDGDCVGNTHAPDVVYSYTPPMDVSVDISLCGSDYDTLLYVYAGACGGATYRCNDDSCGLDSKLEGVPLFGGTTYYIVVDGYDDDSGNYMINVTSASTPAGLSCPAGALFGQSAHGPFDEWFFALADSAWEYTTYENFQGASGLIDSVHWWGFQVDGNEITNCARSPDDVTVTFYYDASGQPGGEACGPYTVTPTVTDTGLDYMYDVYSWRLYEFSAEISPVCTLASGWVSVHSTGGDPDCWLLWTSSPDGDGLCYMGDGSDMYPQDMDLSLCLVGEALPDEDGDGVPDDLDVCPGYNDRADEDNDGVPDGCDHCPQTPDGMPVDADGCVPFDEDGDGVPDDLDVCPGYNDRADEDNDGVPDGCDHCPQTPGGMPVDADGCVAFDEGGDDDGDGVGNKRDICPNTESCAIVNAVGCPIDSDGDGVCDGCDLCPNSSWYDAVDDDGCSLGQGARQAAPADRWGSCCGSAGPVAPLGLAVGMLLLTRVHSRKGRGGRR